MENSKSPYRAQGIKSQRIYGRRKRPEIALREERALGGELRNWKTANPRTEPQRIYGRRKRPEIALREERALEGELRNWNRRLEKWQKQE